MLEGMELERFLRGNSQLILNPCCFHSSVCPIRGSRGGIVGVPSRLSSLKQEEFQYRERRTERNSSPADCRGSESQHSRGCCRGAALHRSGPFSAPQTHSLVQGEASRVLLKLTRFGRNSVNAPC